MATTSDQRRDAVAFRKRMMESARQMTASLILLGSTEDLIFLLNEIDGCSAAIREFVDLRVEEETPMGETDQS